MKENIGCINEIGLYTQMPSFVAGSKVRYFPRLSSVLSLGLFNIAASRRQPFQFVGTSAILQTLV